ncbi:hypothetical protein GCK32_016524, partial [Trichostrongylus colubriformis]
AHTRRCRGCRCGFDISRIQHVSFLCSRSE